MVSATKGPTVLLTVLSESLGWKELHFRSPTSEFLAFGPPTMCLANGTTTLDKSHRFPQPVAWKTSLQDRDGKGSGASVKIYRGKEPREQDDDVPLRSDLQSSGDPFYQPPLPEGVADGLLLDEALMQDAERDKEVLVVMKRGKGASYVQDGSEQFDGLTDLRGTMGWNEITEKGLLRDGTDDPFAHL